MRALSARFPVLAALAASCLSLPCCGAAPRDTQVRVVVDTDLPVPLVIGRLRIDVYSESGAWLDTRDVRQASHADWPASFDLYTPHGHEPKRVRVRARAYTEGALRDYKGERYEPPPASDARPGDAVPPAAPTDGPRLVREGRDETPASEPLPTLAVDRTAWVTPHAGEHRTVRLLLGGACAGRMVDLAGDTTCLGGERVATPEAEEGVDSGPSLVGTFGRSAPASSLPRVATRRADGTPLYDDEALVEGGAFILGTRAVIETGSPSADGGSTTPLPERIVAVPSFFVDRYEVTVARWRNALDQGYAPARDALVVNDGTLAFDATSPKRGCTYSTVPMTGASRETFPLTCIFASDAASFCEHEGGALLTEARWELLASTWGHAHKSLQPAEASSKLCETAVVARDPFQECHRLGFGPSSVDASPDDVTRGPSLQSVLGLTGNAAEIVSDDFRPYDSVCWARAAVLDPKCDDPSSGFATVRGGSFESELGALVSTSRTPIPRNLVAPAIGFRCSRTAL